MERKRTGVLTRANIFDYLMKPYGEGLFISPILDDNQIQDTSIDLRLGHRILVPNRSRLGTIDIFDEDLDKEFGEKEQYREILVHYGNGFNLHPGQSVLVGTLEYIGMPKDLEGFVTLRSSLSRLPILANTAMIHPGFRGVITLSFTSMAGSPIVLRPGERVAQLQLQTLYSSVNIEKESRYEMAIGPAASRLHLDDDLQHFGPINEPTIVIGLVSTLGAGRTTAVKYLQERHGFAVFSLAEIIKLEAVEKGASVDRSDQQNMGNYLRDHFGSDYLAKKLLVRRSWKLNSNPFVVADGIKHPKEVEEFRKQKHFFLLAIDAPLEERWLRTQKLRRIGDPTTLEEFIKIDNIDRGIGNFPPYNQKVDEVIKLADYLIQNDGGFDEFYTELEAVLNIILYPKG